MKDKPYIFIFMFFSTLTIGIISGCSSSNNQINRTSAECKMLGFKGIVSYGKQVHCVIKESCSNGEKLQDGSFFTLDGQMRTINGKGYSLEPQYNEFK